MGIANRAMILMQRLVQEINIAEAFASAIKMIKLTTQNKSYGLCMVISLSSEMPYIAIPRPLCHNDPS
jgi:hypothetical protein